MASKTKTTDSSFDRLVRWLFRPVDIASMVFFRIVYGLVIIGCVAKLWKNGFITDHYVDVDFRFTYPFFGWLPVLPDVGLYSLFVLMAIAGACITVGFMYRAAALTFGLAWTYTFILAPSVYQNHFYLLCLVGLMAAAMPMHRAFSIDVWLRPKIASSTIPAWCVHIIQFQIGIVYFFGGIHKFNPDWLHGEPMRAMLWGRATWFPGWGQVFYLEPVVYFFAISGLLLDLLIVPALLWRRTRVFAFCAIVLFHVMNLGLWYIGIFPPFMIAATALYFRPDWPRLVIAKIRRQPTPVPTPTESPAPNPLRRAFAAFLIAYVAVQCAVPWRPYVLNPGHLLDQEDLLWFSWNMMLRERQASLVYMVTDLDTGEEWTVEVQDMLSEKQFGQVLSKPDMVHELALHLAEESRAEGHQNVSVRALNNASVNYRVPQLIIDPTVDLAAMPRKLGFKPWVLPLKEPYPTFMQSRVDLQKARWRFLSENGYLPYTGDDVPEDVARALAKWQSEYYRAQGLGPDGQALTAEESVESAQ